MSDETVRCDFSVGGISQAKEAFRTVEQSMLRLESLSVASSMRELRVREKTQKSHVAAAMQGERDILAATLRGERERIRASDMTTTAKRRAMRDLLSESTRMERDLTNVIKREIATREAAEKAAAHASVQRRKQMGEALTGGVGRGITRPLSGAMRYGGMALAMGGGFAIADAAHGYMASQSAAVGLANSMFDPGNADQQKWLAKNGKNGRFDTKKLMALANETAASTGVDKTQLLQGWQGYVAKASDWEAFSTDSGKKSLAGMAKLATASGTDIGQLMNAAGSLRVQNPNLSPEKMDDMMRAIVGQGKKGAVEISDLAMHASTITGGSGKFVGKGGYKDQAEAQTALLGLSQIAIRTSAGAAEAATAVKAFGSDLGGKARKAQKTFAAEGLKIQNDDGSMLKTSTIVENIFNATKGNTSRMGEGKGNIGMGRESIRIMEALKTQFDIGKNEALAKNPTMSQKDANAAGAKAAGDEVRKYENTTYDQKDIDRDHAEVMATASKKIEVATAKIRTALETKLAPVVERLADAFANNGKSVEEFIEAVSKVAAYLVANPFLGIGIVVSGSILKEIAKAGMAEGLKQAMQLDVVKNAMSKFAGVTGTAAAAVVAVAVGMKLIDDAMAKKSKAQSDAALAGGGSEEARIKLKHKVQDGTATEADINEARSAAVAARNSVNKQESDNDPENMGVLQRAAYDVGNMADPEAMKTEREAQTAALARTKASLDALTLAIEASAAALKAHAKAAAFSDPHNPTRNAPQSHPARGGASG